MAWMGLGTQSTGAGRSREGRRAAEPAPGRDATAVPSGADQDPPVPDEVLAAARSVFADRAGDVVVLDLVADSVLDHPAGQTGDVRALRFAGEDCSVDVAVHGVRHLSVGIRAWPSGRIAVEAQVRRSEGREVTRYPCVPLLTPVSPGVTSFHVHWPDGEHAPVRTAWVLL